MRYHIAAGSSADDVLPAKGITLDTDRDVALSLVSESDTQLLSARHAVMEMAMSMKDSARADSTLILKTESALMLKSVRTSWLRT